jgi:hypothetical protein
MVAVSTSGPDENGMQFRHSMQFGQVRPRLVFRGAGSSRLRHPLSKALAWLGAGVMFASAVAISIVLFAVVLTGAVAFGGYLWWKTRDLRKQMQARPGPGNVIEGVVIRESLSRHPDGG